MWDAGTTHVVSRTLVGHQPQMQAAEDDPYLDAPEDLEDDVSLAVGRLSMGRDDAGDTSSYSSTVPGFVFFDPKRDDLAAWRVKSEQELYSTIAECYRAIDLFMDSQIAAAENYLRDRVSESLYFGIPFRLIN